MVVVRNSDVVPEEKVTSSPDEVTSSPDAQLADGMTDVPDRAFIGCKTLTSVDLPASVTRIGMAAFSQCSALRAVSVRSSRPTTIEQSAFYGCKALTSIAIPSVRRIDDFAFSRCISLRTVTCGSVEEIGLHAFEDCMSLTELMIPSTVTCIGEYAFSGCVLARVVRIPASISQIKGSTFRHCRSLTNVVIPASVKRIGPFAFEGCSVLTTVTIEGCVTEIRANAFAGCPVASVTVASTTMLGENAFGPRTTVRRLPRAQIYLRLWRKFWHMRRIAIYWQQRSVERACAPGGQGRKRDREAFEREFACEASSTAHVLTCVRSPTAAMVPVIS